MFVADLRHYLDIPDDALAPARRMAERLSLIVRAATAGASATRWVSALGCSRRPTRRACPGNIALFRREVPPAVDWWCTGCGDEGIITGWDGSPYDLRTRALGSDDKDMFDVPIGSEIAATLRDVAILDDDCERLVFRAFLGDRGVTITTNADALEELVGYIAADANHEANWRRRRRLDDAFAVLEAVLAGHAVD